MRRRVLTISFSLFITGYDLPLSGVNNIGNIIYWLFFYFQYDAIHIPYTVLGRVSHICLEYISQQYYKIYFLNLTKGLYSLLFMNKLVNDYL